MASDNLVFATNSLRTSITTLKSKLSKLRVSLEEFDSAMEKIEGRFSNLLNQAEIYKSKVERESTREVRRLEREITQLKSKPGSKAPVSGVNEKDLKIASSIGIFDAILRHMCKNAEDFRLASEAFLFPAVYERIMEGSEDAYFLDHIPSSANTVIDRGREHIDWVRSEFDTHLTDEESWNGAIDAITDWWRNDALPLLYGARDEQWDIDLPLTWKEMMLWKENPGQRPMEFPAIYDAYELYNANKEEVFGTTGLREFELKLFSF